MTPSSAGANLPALRGHNAALVLDLLRAAALAGGPPGGGLSRPELAERTGLTPQAVSKITARLREEGLVEESGHRSPTGGKPRSGLRLAARARSAVGVHLDGRTMTSVLTDLAGRTVAARTLPLDLGQPVEEALAAVTAEVRATVALAGRGPVAGVGVGMRGPLDHRTGVLHRVTGYPHWEGCRLRDDLSRRLGGHLPVTVDKNTNAAALAVRAALRTSALRTSALRLPAAAAGTATATAAAGAGTGDAAGTGAASFAYLHLGAGLGAGLVLDGEVYRGGRTGAGEFGHQAVDPGGPVCGCGNRGCLEALCLAAVASGDLREAARLVGLGAANLVALLDVDAVVLGGATVRSAPDLFRAETTGVLAGRGRAVPVTLAPPRAVAEGAALLALAPLFTGAALR